jgi:hypothetical protein
MVLTPFESQSFIAATLRVATLHCVRGIPKSAEYYAQQAVDFAKDLGSVRLQARAMLVRVEVLVHKGNTEAALSDLDLICDLLGTVSWILLSCVSTLTLHPLRTPAPKPSSPTGCEPTCISERRASRRQIPGARKPSESSRTSSRLQLRETRLRGALVVLISSFELTPRIQPRQRRLAGTTDDCSLCVTASSSRIAAKQPNSPRSRPSLCPCIVVADAE